MFQKTIIVAPPLPTILEVTKGLEKPISMASLVRETRRRLLTETMSFRHRGDYKPTDVILQKSLIIAELA